MRKMFRSKLTFAALFALLVAILVGTAGITVPSLSPLTLKAGSNCDADFTNSGANATSYGYGTVNQGDRLYLYSQWGDGASRTVRSSVATQNDTTYSLQDTHHYNGFGNPVYIEVGSNTGYCAILTLTF